MEIEGNGIASPDATILRLILDGLTRIDADGNLQPDLASSWNSGNNDHRWEFLLRPGVRFHNGWPLTPDRVIASLNESCNGDCPWTAVHAVGSSVVFTADSPVPNLPWLLAGNRFLVSLTDAGDGKPPPCCIGTGPFQLSSQDDPHSFAANDSYWQGRPFIDKVEVLTGRSIRDQWLDLSVGRADIVEIPPEDLRQAQQQRLAVAASPPVELLALRISDSGALSNQALRASISEAVDRGALFNVIFEKQGEIAASLLPQELTGYSFLFPADRDLSKARELRGGLTPPPLTLGYEGGGAMQLAAQRIALNLREAGFDVQVVAASRAQNSDLILCRLPVQGADPAAATEILLRAAGETVSVAEQTPLALFRAEREFLNRKTLVPLIDLPRAYAIGPRVRDLRLRGDGTPDLASASLEDAP
ncbi:MAG: ABC transporter substrate-binding protein [Terracidiphilus sp.]